MSLDLILAGAAGGVVGAATVLAAQAVTAAVAKMGRPTSSHPEPHPFAEEALPWTGRDTTGSSTLDITAPTEPNAEATAHARLRAPPASLLPSPNW
jgi:hypothetical protein